MVYTKNMYKRYKAQLDSVITFAEAQIDHDDMAECADTFVESEKYKEFQTFMNSIADNYPDLHYIYLMKVVDEGKEIDGVAIFEICCGNSLDEIGTDMELHLGDGEVDWFDEAQIKEYRKILAGKKDVYFKNESTWGVDYTLARPMCDSNGNYYGLLCADIGIDEINTTIYKNIWINIAMIAVVGALFIAFLILWMRRNVISPLKKLENSVTDFANSSAGVRNPEELLYVSPNINTKNEVESLARAYDKLAVDMKDYVIGIVAAENEAKGLKQHVSEINAIAHKDALTHVKNKTAYEEKREQLIKEIESGNASFGVVMADINSLKEINDKYGHERGDQYIIGACMLISQIYKHSPVYRIGGDEFVVILQGGDLENRDVLLAEARLEFKKAMSDTSKDPWRRYSAAVGMSVWNKDDDFDTVFRRADKLMYEEKAEIKKNYKID